MTYYFKATALLLKGARYDRLGFWGTALIIAQRKCRLHWLRDSLTREAV